MTEKRNNRSGVALIIVLGLVAVLLIVSVAFTINMRVERAGAANLRHAVVARQVVKGAMAAAIAAIDEEVGDDMAPQWYATNSPSDFVYERKYVDAHNKPVTRTQWKNTYVSYDPSNLEHVDANFFTPEVASYFPSGSSYKGYATKYVASGSTTKEVDLPEWLPVYADAGNKDVMGRYAFFVLDTSGLLDASCVNRTNRWMGRDPAEIHLAPALFSGEVLNAETLAANMVADGRYDSFAEFAARNESGNNPPIKNTRSFSTFSYEPMPTNELVYIGGDAASLRRNKRQIIKAFYDSGLTAGKSFGAKDCEQARWAYLGLVDYVDGDDKMEPDDKINPWERPATENMPVVSGFIAKLRVTWREKTKKNPEDESQYVKDTEHAEIKFDADFKIPFAYPFTELDAPQVDLEGKGTFFVMSLGEEDTLKLSPYNPEAGYGQKIIAVKEQAFESEPHDNSIIDLTVESPEWLEVPASGGKPFSLKNWANTGAPCAVWVMAAGQTKRDGKVQHRFPIDANDYSAPCGPDHSGKPKWMTVYYDFSTENEDFDFAKGATKTETVNGVTVDVWEKEVVVWAEMLDPRFASLAMAAYDPTTFGLSKYYRPSHNADNYPATAYHAIPITKIKAEGEHKGLFSDFMAAKSNAAMVNDFKGGGNDAQFFGVYFAGRAAQNGGGGCYTGGTGPLTSYILTHPDVATEVYQMNMDGVRIAPGEDEGTTDTARTKWRAFVKNAPLQSVGELGYLPIGIWSTIRLYDYGNNGKASCAGVYGEIAQFNHIPSDDADDAPPFHPVLDYFTVVDIASGERVKGRVNVNSLNEGALASVFYRMPIGTEQDSPLCRWPVPDSKTSTKFRLTEEGAKKVAKGLVACRDDGDFKTLSDLGYALGYGADSATSRLQGGDVTGYALQAVQDSAESGNEEFGEFERESVIRNSCGLFTTRGQTFIIAVRGESYSPMFGKTSVKGGSVNAAKTAVAQVWRDSEPDENGNHPIFIQFFKIIDD